MATQEQIDRWEAHFGFLSTVGAEERAFARKHVHFPRLDEGAVAYAFDDACENYLMCLKGGTRAFRRMENGREMLIYRVRPGGTCLLTTQSLLSGGGFPAESVADAATEMAALPTAAFRRLMAQSAEFRGFVLADYSRLLATMVELVEEVASATLAQKLARRLLADAAGDRIVRKTHQQIADDIGSVREVVSRQLGEWERAGVVRGRRGEIEVVDRVALSWLRA